MTFVFACFFLAFQSSAGCRFVRLLLAEKCIYSASGVVSGCNINCLAVQFKLFCRAIQIILQRNLNCFAAQFKLCCWSTWAFLQVIIAVPTAQNGRSGKIFGGFRRSQMLCADREKNESHVTSTSGGTLISNKNVFTWEGYFVVIT